MINKKLKEDEIEKKNLETISNKKQQSKEHGSNMKRKKN